MQDGWLLRSNSLAKLRFALVAYRELDETLGLLGHSAAD